jgi:hypothetical protein
MNAEANNMINYKIPRYGLNKSDGSEKLKEKDLSGELISVCVKASVAEHARFSDNDDVCDDGR